MAVKEAEATNALADAGCDVITCHVDGPKVVMETAAGRGAFICGYHANQSVLAPDKYLTGAEWNWAKVYTDMVATTLTGAPIPNFVRGGLADGFIKMSPLGPANSDAARAQFEADQAEILKGGFCGHQGPAEGQHGQCHRRRGPGVRGNRRGAGKHGLSGRRRPRLDLVSAAMSVGRRDRRRLPRRGWRG